MTDIIHNLSVGFGVALTPSNALYCLIGATLGTLVGVLPGLGPVTTIAMLLPFTFKLPAVASLIMLSGIYYGAHHAAATSAIMLNMPGEPTSVVICIDGHPMARQGRAGPALCTSALSSFFAGCVSIVVLALFSPLLAEAAKSFGSAEYASMIIMALITVSVISSASTLTTISMAVLGLALATVGSDLDSGVQRFTFNLDNIADRISFVALAVALFAFASIMSFLGTGEIRQLISTKVTGLFPTRKDLAASWKPILRGTALGSIIGIFPGTGPMVASFAAYSMEKRLAADPSRFGNGAIEGVAGPEAANNASAFTHYIPMLTLGIPAGPAMALMLAALTIQGVTAGPELITKHADLFWGVIASMWIGNLMLLVLNLPLIGIWIRLLAVPYRILYPVVLMCCCVGIYTVQSSAADVIMAAVFGLVGLVFDKLRCPPAPLILGFILEPVLEENFRRAMLLARGDITTFVTRPISLGILLLSVALLFVFTRPKARRGSLAAIARS